MSAEARGLDPLVSAAFWKPSISGKDVKDPGNHHRRRVGKAQRQVCNQKSCFFGLETRPELVWEDWDLGREFTKILVLKNIHNKLQKLHIRPPVSTFFSLLNPQIIFISPGTSFSIQVIFRPLERCEYEDSIEFQGKEGSFQVCLRAIIPCHTLEVPESVMLPLCAVEHSTHTDFLLKNASKLQTHFQWECDAPFQLSPVQGLLKPGQECHITVVFQPQDALVYRKQAYCRFGDGDKLESCCTVLLQGLAKYPYLQLRNPSSKDQEEQGTPVVHFGSVGIGQSLQKHFDIFNPTPVTVSFTLSRLPGGVPLFGSEFTCDVTRGKVAPGRSQRVSVTYSPAVVDNVSVEYLSLKFMGALNETQLKLTGNCIGPNVSLTSCVVNFECIEEGGSGVRKVELVNSSAVEAIYQWDIDCSGNSVFSILPASGTVLPHSHTTLKVVYRPTLPNAHHRRVACLILHRDPVFLDLIGTCHSEFQKPAVLKPEHLALYKLHWWRRHNSPDSLSVLQQHHNIQFDQQVQSPIEEQSVESQNDATMIAATPMEEFCQTCLGCMDPLASSSSLSLLHVSVAPSELLFNHKNTSCSSTSSAFSQDVSITNHTNGKLSLVWTVAQGSSFLISPSSCDLSPLESTSFSVKYVPLQLNTLHGAQLECFAYYKDNQDMGQGMLSLPWCVTVRVIGHSFQPGKEHFIPCCSLKPPQVVFPALSVISYRTVLLHNDGDLPLTFCLDHSPNPALADSVFVVPSCGLIQPGDHQILTLRTMPTEDSSKQGFKLHLQLNATELTKELKVVSVVEKLCVSLEGGSSLYFQPTAVGSQAQRTHHIRNLSLLPIRFQWSISEPDQELISVEPDAGELHPNESSIQTWYFSPLAEKKYRLNPTLTYWPTQMDGSSKSHITLKVEGMGSRGSIEAEKAVLDVGEILVGSCGTIEVPLVNKSPCPVSFTLSVQQISLDDEHTCDSAAQQSALHLDCDRGTIVPHSTMLIRSSFRPKKQAQYLWNIRYQTLNARGFVLSPPQTVCEVRARGVFPTLQVTDARSSGSVSRLSKVHLWKLFSLDSLNDHLLSSPSSEELTYRTPTRHSLHSCPSVFTKTILDFNFGSAPVNSDPSNVVLMFHNPRSIPVDWAFLFPEDQQIELEYWAVTGEFSSTELHQMKIQDNQLFSISPRSGTLLPGQKRAVHFRYSHIFAGTDHFPVVLKISYGREILVCFENVHVRMLIHLLQTKSTHGFMVQFQVGEQIPPSQWENCIRKGIICCGDLLGLNFQGVTVEQKQPYLHFASHQHIFTSVTIGDCRPPRQGYEIHNGGAVPVCYEVETAVLSQLQMDNFNHPVLCCLNPQGEVPPGKTTLLEWIFSPLEAKTYQVDVPIHIRGGDSSLVRFEGCGLNTLTLGSPNQFNCSDYKAFVPCVQRGPFPGQVLFLSEDSIFLGDIPVCSQFSRIVFLTNVSHTNTAHYTWDLPQHSNQQIVQIHPDQGRLHPGECALCVLVFTPTDYPTFHQLDLICQVTLEAELTEYHETLQQWEEERERQKNEFIITDKNIRVKTSRVFIDEVPSAVPARKGPPLRKYKTLPPICGSSSEAVATTGTKLTRAERRVQREIAERGRHPEPPQPALLHLWVTAHSHGLMEYLTHFPDHFNKHYRHLQSINIQHSETTSSTTSVPTGLSTTAYSPEKESVLHILECLLRNILDDSAFVQSLVTFPFKPNPYQPTEVSSSDCPSFPSSPCQCLCSTSFCHSRPQTQALLSSAGDREETAGYLENRPQTQTTQWTERVTAFMSEGVLMNTLQNLMMEVVRGEFVLEAHPHSSILTPVSARRQMSEVITEEGNI